MLYRHLIIPLGLAGIYLFPLANAVVDLNSNGVCDIWEQKYSAASLVADAAAKAGDEDGDGQTNLSEALAGTNPRSAESVHRINSLTRAAAVITIVCPTEKGKTYQPAFSSNLSSGSWTLHGSPVLATGNTMMAELSGQSGNEKFYRVVAQDTDTDSDGIPDWAEEQLAGFDPNNSDSFTSGTPNNDLTALQANINALSNGEVTITATTPDAFEKENTAAQFTVARTGATIYPLTVFFSLSGHSNTSKGSASAGDYVLKDAANAVIQGSIVIPAGSSSVQIFCHPVSDALTEVPETLTCTLSGTNSSAAVRICDATNIPANARLFLAQLSPEPGVVSTGSGLSTVLLQGDNSVGHVNLNFYGLTKPQTAVHIHIKNPINGPHVESLPMGQINGHPWNILAAHFIATDQGMLDALLAGQLYINVHSSNYPAGEIRGDFLASSGSTNLVVPAAPPAIATLTGDELDRDIARFLTQCTFGATPELITELRNLVTTAPHNGDRLSAYGAWLDAQVAMTSTNLEPHVHATDAQQIFLASIPNSPGFKADYTPASSARHNSWWTLAKAAPDQYRQRVTFALSEIFVTSSNDNIVDDRHYGHAHYFDMLKDGAFGSYRDLLEDVSTHPIMGQYLSHLRNSKAILDGSGNVIVSPDENYAREVMQLFSIGLVKLHEDGSLKLDATGLPEPTYQQDDISAMSRVFTGWSFSKRNDPSKSATIVDNTTFSYGSGSRYYQAQWSNRMKNFASFHDTDEKVIPTLGLTIPAGGDGESDLDATMNHLAAHTNTAPFIIRLLIQRLVTSNPSAGYIYRVTQVWKSTNGNLNAVFKAILLDHEARSLDATAPISYGKKKEPLIHTLAVLRALGADSKLPLAHLNPADTSIADLSQYAYAPDKLALFTAELSKFPAGTKRMRMNNTDGNIGQTPLHAPTVFNWFLSDYSVVGPLANAGLRVPEFQIATEISVVTNVNLLYSLIHSSNGISGSSLRNQKSHDANGAPHPVYNPYGYGDNDDHQTIDLTGASAMGQAYLAIMDTNADGKVTSADTTFDNRSSIVNACAALVDHLDLLLTSGRLKSDFSSGYIADIVRADNPRDIIIDTVANYSTSLDDNDNDVDQASVLKGRLKAAAYLIANSPQAIIQR